MTKVTRGIRANNPGNIEKGEPWQGLAKPEDMTVEQKKEKRFAVFKDPTFGIRAIARILITYQDKHGLGTIEKMIGRWAPPSENDTKKYAAFVAKAVGVDVDDKVDVHEYEIIRPMIEAIILMENGTQPYTDAQIEKGLTLAGITAKAKPLSKSRTVKGGQVVAVGTAGSVVAEIVQQAEPALPWLRMIADYAPYVLGAVVVLGLGYMLWARLDDRRKGLR